MPTYKVYIDRIQGLTFNIEANDEQSAVDILDEQFYNNTFDQYIIDNPPTEVDMITYGIPMSVGEYLGEDTNA